ncbi:MAG: prolyl 4-hydroxylase [Sphingomonadales bacterium]|jgi:prolyl 4-hydroxylase|nr:prolyl 4-hydroxylase [Sphingomonadales bacterium]
MAGGGTIGRMEALLGARRHAEAARLLIAAAAGGEPEAAAELGRWRVAGSLIRRDLAEARRLFALAGAKGDAEAGFVHAAFLAGGVGGPDDWQGALAVLTALARRDSRAAAQLGLIERMDLDTDGFPKLVPASRRLSPALAVAAADSFMSRDECAYLRAAGEPALEPSVVVDPATGAMVPHPVRTSDAAVFGVFDEDLVINALNRRIAALSGTRPEQGEPLQLLRYRPGGEYRAHMDALPAEPNQRILTVLVYLSDDYEGGETVFPRLGLSFRGGTGDALLFRNAGPDGRADPLTVHAGLPIARGTKYLASRWIRAARLSFPPPRPLLDL